MHWKIGNVKITKVVELETVGHTRFILPLAGREEIRQLPWLIPHFATEDGRLKMSIHALVVETPTRRIVVDTGLGNDKQHRTVPTWNDRKGPFLDDLTAAGFPPESIDTVLCTHLHVDHVGWNTRLQGGRWVPTFEKARYLFGASEYAYWRDHSVEPDKAAVFADSVAPIVAAGQADLVASDARICEEITLVPTPGHSPGHVSLHIRCFHALPTGRCWSSAGISTPAISSATAMPSNSSRRAPKADQRLPLTRGAALRQAS
jgi:glyoxylase-like metal-dependent hydrolase (beta-lactamase superfamily II)